MLKFMKKRKARGFTLVELLIVIIIIGILAGALLLAAGAGTDKANATKVVSDMRGIKTAAVMIYADYNAWPAEGEIGNGSNSFDEYLDRDVTQANVADYYVVSGDGGTGIYIEAQNIDSAVKGKLADIAGESGIYGTAVSNDIFEASDTNAYMRVK